MFKAFLLSTLLLAFNASAQTVMLGCSLQDYACLPSSNGQQQCRWASYMGKIYSLDLEKTGSTSAGEIWEGKLNETVFEHDAEIKIYQYIEGSKKITQLNINLFIDTLTDKITLSSSGENIASVKFLNTKTNTGVGIYCSTNIGPAEEE